MTQTLIGYARCSTDKQDLAAQHHALLQLGVAADRIYTDKGFTGTNRERPGLDQALVAVRSGDTLVVPKLDRLARSVPDARAIGDALAARGVKLQLGANVHDPADPMGKLFFNVLATFAEFEADLIRLRTREGMAVARAEEGEPRDMAVQEGLGGFSRIGLHEAGIRLRQIQAEEVDLLPSATDHRERFSEIHLAVTRRVR